MAKQMHIDRAVDSLMQRKQCDPVRYQLHGRPLGIMPIFKVIERFIVAWPAKRHDLALKAHLA